MVNMQEKYDKKWSVPVYVEVSETEATVSYMDGGSIREIMYIKNGTSKEQIIEALDLALAKWDFSYYLEFEDAEQAITFLTN